MTKRLSSFERVWISANKSAIGGGGPFNYLGRVALAQENYLEATHRHQQAQAIFSEIGNQWGHTNSLIKLGEVAFWEKQYQVAWRQFVGALRTAVEIQAIPHLIPKASCFL